MAALGVVYALYVCYAAFVIYAYILFEVGYFPLHRKGSPSLSKIGSFIVSAFTELSFGGTMFLLQGIS